MTSPSQVHGRNLTIPEGCVVLEPESGGFIPWDNPDNLISQATEQAVDRAVNGVCLPLLFLVSVPCNLLNMLVFFRHGLRERINLCLFYLSLVDFLHMFNNILCNLNKFLPHFTEDGSFGPVLEFVVDHHLTGFVRGFNWLSGFISMVIACERCLCVASPLRSQTVMKTQTTGTVLTVASLLIVASSLVVGLRWGIACRFDSATNSTSRILYASQFYTRNEASLDVVTFFVATFQPLTYVTVVSVTTTVTSVKLRRLVAWREQASSATLSSREVALTRTLMAVSVVYVVCSVPSMAAGVLVALLPDMSLKGRYYNFGNLFVSLMELASFVNATFNFVVYCLLGSRYRETLWAVLRCRPLGPMTRHWAKTAH